MQIVETFKRRVTGIKYNNMMILRRKVGVNEFASGQRNLALHR